MSKPAGLFPEIKQISAQLKFGSSQDRVIVIIPSHDRNEKALSSKAEWAQEGLDLLGELYGGGTAFDTLAGVFRTKAGGLLHDKPILLESYAERTDVEDRRKLQELLSFLKRLGKETHQAAVAIIINDAFYTISKYGDV